MITTFNVFQLHRIFDISLRYTNKIKQQKTFALIIGANNGVDDDTLMGYVNAFDWRALLIEPLPEHINELKRNFNRQIKQGKIVIAEECVSDCNEKISFGYIPYETILQENLHPAIRGMSCIIPPLNGFKTDPNTSILFEKYKRVVSFDTKTIDQICEEYFIEHIDFVQCDVEGYDGKVLSKFNFAKYSPNIFKFETRNNNDIEHKELVKLFESNNYSVHSLLGDSLAINNDHLKTLKNSKRWNEVVLLENATTDNIPASFGEE